MELPDLNPTELNQVALDAESRLAQTAEALMPEIITSLFSSADLVILGALGIDARVKILDVFIQKCTKLKEDIENERT